jgi:hypothetical protein
MTKIRFPALYLKFIQLIIANNHKEYIPTIDIDLVWNAHQIDSYNYNIFCVQMANKLITKNKIMKGDLEKIYSKTFIKWRQEYNKVYSTILPNWDSYQKGHELSFLNPFYYGYRWWKWNKFTSQKESNENKKTHDGKSESIDSSNYIENIIDIINIVNIINNEHI